MDYDKQEIEQVLNSLISNGELIKINEEVYLHKTNYEKALEILKEYIGKNDSITVAEYRDILNTNRKVHLNLLGDVL